MSMHMNAKRTMLIGIGLLAILMLAAVPMMAMAQEETPETEQAPPSNGGRERQRLKLRVDRDGDGNISLREFYAFVNGRLDNDQRIMRGVGRPIGTVTAKSPSGSSTLSSTEDWITRQSRGFSTLRTRTRTVCFPGESSAMQLVWPQRPK
ncbi:MAG: hypothetical protein MUC62_10215 [Candidatus Thermoplasmatota archaeon]|nr:hypothetical protein [Candidatus Thermoplasmatota archaeon]